ncbi:hypothetical protein BC939DRAFT_462652 [Gamsiella multidivaricata]|uniref:uncharacterized protein n=1 Tax=Gamsiella multidivaricata TaxID=101098 RepID=UPI002220D602|nr:uncharacterized protein BC939DRAFT_462652 [Gamsiella multidivaricata]KAI7818607.1 hypothetical protein BC939DRAFT_462652 [Gamsiella multidivaricata]
MGNYGRMHRHKYNEVMNPSARARKRQRKRQPYLELQYESQTPQPRPRETPPHEIAVNAKDQAEVVKAFATNSRKITDPVEAFLGRLRQQYLHLQSQQRFPLPTDTALTAAEDAMADLRVIVQTAAEKYISAMEAANEYAAAAQEATAMAQEGSGCNSKAGELAGEAACATGEKATETERSVEEGGPMDKSESSVENIREKRKEVNSASRGTNMKEARKKAKAAAKAAEAMWKRIMIEAAKVEAMGEVAVAELTGPSWQKQQDQQDQQDQQGLHGPQ